MNKTVKKGKTYFMENYKQLPVVMEKGKGNYLYDDQGRAYLDFVAGIATNALGYSYKPLIKAVRNQAKKMTHCSNLYYNKPSVEAAKLLVKLSELDKVFFCNSGAEANEAALKLAKRYTNLFVSDKKTKIISMKNSFHGRTIATLSATGQTKYHEGFAPLFKEVRYAEFNNLESLKDALDDETAILIIEPIQGEGGIVPAEIEFLKGARDLCDALNIVLIFDEVQCGIGRTGKVFAYEHYGVKPDIVSLAKGLGAGYAIGAIVASKKIAQGFEPGTHASTFGGNPIGTTGAQVMLKTLSNGQLLQHVNKVANQLKNGLMKLQDNYEVIIDVRGKGLMMAIELKEPVGELVTKALDKGLLLINSGSHVIRFVPPLTIKKREVNLMLSILETLLKEVHPNR